jgi:hypothetical protein
LTDVEIEDDKGGETGMKKTAVVVLIILLAIGGSLYYLWRQATLLPAWYKTGAGGSYDGTVVTYGQGLEAARKSLERTIENQLRRKASTRGGQVEVTLNEADANKLFASVIAENREKYPYLKAIKASRMRIRDGNLDFGVVVDASEALGHASAEGEKGAPLSGLLQGKEVALGFSGKHGLNDGSLQLDEDGKIRIGGLTFSLKTITKRLGISEDKLKNTEFGKLKIDTIQPKRNTLLLRGASPPP